MRERDYLEKLKLVGCAILLGPIGGFLYSSAVLCIGWLRPPRDDTTYSPVIAAAYLFSTTSLAWALVYYILRPGESALTILNRLWTTPKELCGTAALVLTSTGCAGLALCLAEPWSQQWRLITACLLTGGLILGASSILREGGEGTHDTPIRRIKTRIDAGAVLAQVRKKLSKKQFERLGELVVHRSHLARIDGRLVVKFVFASLGTAIVWSVCTARLKTFLHGH